MNDAARNPRHNAYCTVVVITVTTWSAVFSLTFVVIVGFFTLLDDDDDNDDEVERFWMCCFIWIYHPFLILENAFQVDGIQQRLLQRILYNDTRTKLK